MRKVIVSTYMTLDGRVDEIRDWAVAYKGLPMVGTESRNRNLA